MREPTAATTWRLHKTNVACGLLALAGIVQFAVCLVLAVRAYPGGYQAASHYLSDLGCTRTAFGASNATSAAYFNGSVIRLGVMLLPFFALTPAVLESGSWLVRVSGVLSALGLIGIGLTPYDTMLASHLLALGLWIVPMIVAVVAFAWNVDVGGRVRSALFLGTIAVLVSVCGYVMVESHSGHVVFQKILVVVAACWLGVVFLIVSISTIQSMTTRRALVERQAAKYMQVLQRQYRRRSKR